MRLDDILWPEGTQLWLFGEQAATVTQAVRADDAPQVLRHCLVFHGRFAESPEATALLLAAERLGAARFFE